MDTLPADVASHIRCISSGLHMRLQPRARGCTQSPFFQPCMPSNAVPTVEDRTVGVMLPPELRDVYRKYPSDIEFYDGGRWTMLCEDEIATRSASMRAAGQPRMIDFAVAYAGMGHVFVASFDPVGGGVVQMMDGGANGFEREANALARQCVDVATLPHVTFRDWWDGRNE